MTDELHPTEDEVIDPLNPAEDSDEDLEFLDEPETEPEESQEPDGSQKALDTYNAELKKRGLNKNYKSWDDVYKHETAVDTHFAKKGMENVEQPKVEPKKEEVITEKLPSNLSERLMKVEVPESVFVLEDIKKAFPGQDPYDVWNNSEYFKKEAAIRAENERNAKRIANPSGNTEGQAEVDEVEQKFINNLPERFKIKK